MSVTIDDPLLAALGLRYSARGSGTFAVHGSGERWGADECIDWAPDWPALYPNQDRVISMRVAGRRYLLPSVLVFDEPELAWLEESGQSTHRCELRPGVFRSPDADTHPAVLAAAKRAFSDGKDFFDGHEHARLVEWEPNATRLAFQRASYFAYIATNLGLDKASPGLLPLRRRDRRHSLHPLPGAPFANIVGVDILAFSRNGHALLVRRGARPLVRPNQISGAWSGTLAWDDLMEGSGDSRSSSFDLRRPAAMERWLADAGVAGDRIRRTQFLGLTRELVRGGQPQLAYAVELDIEPDEWVEASGTDTDGAHVMTPFGRFGACQPKEAGRLAAHLPKLLQALGGLGAPVSVPLLTTIALWYRRSVPAEVSLPTVQNALATDHVPEVSGRRWLDVKLSNFVGFREARMKFGPGINLVVGENASGKSHLLEALFALDRAFDGRPVFPLDREPIGIGDCMRGVFGDCAGLSRRPGSGTWTIEASYVDDEGPASARVEWTGMLGARLKPARRRVGGPVFLPANDLLDFGAAVRAAPEGRAIQLDLDTLVQRNRTPEGGRVTEIEALMGGRRLSLDSAGRPVLVAPDGEILDWSRAADGWKRLAVFALVMGSELPSGSVLYWDEPDDAINPSLFPVVGQMLAELAQRGVQIFAATHSLALVRWIHLKAEEQKVPLAYTFLERLPGSAEVVATTGRDLYDAPTGMVRAEEDWDRSVLLGRAAKRSKRPVH